jgi:hypothetical protein
MSQLWDLMDNSYELPTDPNKCLDKAKALTTYPQAPTTTSNLVS